MKTFPVTLIKHVIAQDLLTRSLILDSSIRGKSLRVNGYRNLVLRKRAGLIPHVGDVKMTLEKSHTARTLKEIRLTILSFPSLYSMNRSHAIG